MCKKGLSITRIISLKRFISLFLCVILILSIVGCQSSGEKASEGEKSVTSSAEKDNKSNDSSTEKTIVKLTMLTSAATNQPAKDQDIILKELKKQLMEYNIDLDVNTLTDYSNQLNVRIAGGNIPDIFSAGKIEYVEFAKQGILLQLDPYMNNLPSVLKNYSEDIINQAKVDGKMYGISKRPYVNYDLLFVRKDWLDKLGLEVPKTLDEFYNVAVAFRENDPDGNGQKDTYGFSTGGQGIRGFSPIFGAYGTTTPTNIYVVDNTLKYSTTEPMFKEALAYIKKFIDSGAVDPEFLVNTTEVGRQKMFMGQVGMAYFQWSEMTKPPFGDQLKEADPNAEWIYIEPLEGPGGKYLTSTSKAVGSFLCFSSALEKDRQKLEAALKFADLITEGPIHNLLCYGIENKHHKVENGKIVALPEIGEVSYSWVYQLTGRNEMEYLIAKYPICENEIIYAATAPMIETLNGYIINPEGFNYGDLSKYESDEVIKFIYGQKDFSEYDKFIETCYSAYNLSLYLEEAEKQLKQFGILK
ncbi:MAG TPA: extracellular solute-binding protein [Clostridiaceae bacterium]|nr:extracellular solute-binding protein [Clostridiaceae bacterium]